MNSQTFRLKDANGFINPTHYFVSAKAISAAKRESSRRAKSGKFCGNSEIYVVKLADYAASVWAKDETVFIASPFIAA